MAKMIKPDYHIVSFSGGKDSTAMLLRMLELGYQVDEIIFCDTGLEFPSMYEHIDAVERYIGRKVTRLRSEKPFEWYFLEWDNRRETSKCQGQKGMSWATNLFRWCTAYLKRDVLAKHERALKKEFNLQKYIGIASDEQYRLRRAENNKEGHRHPLNDWGWPEAKCLEYCKSKGFNWGGLV